MREATNFFRKGGFFRSIPSLSMQTFSFRYPPRRSQGDRWSLRSAFTFQTTVGPTSQPLATTDTNLEIGQASTLREHMWFQIIGYYGVQWLDLLLDFGMVCGAVLLYSTQRDRPEYLWSWIWVMADFLLIPRETYALLHNYSTSYDTLCRGLSALIGSYAYARMYCAFVDYKVSWKLHIFIAVSAVSSSLAFTFAVARHLTPGLFCPTFSVRGCHSIHCVRARYAHEIHRCDLLIPVLMISLSLLPMRSLASNTFPILRDETFAISSYTLGKYIGPFYVPYGTSLRASRSFPWCSLSWCAPTT